MRILDIIRASRHRKFLLRSSVVAVIQIAGLGLVFLLQILIARLIDDPEQYGLYAWGQSLFFLVGILCAMGAPLAAGKLVAALHVQNNEKGIQLIVRQALKIITIASPIVISATLMLVFLVMQFQGAGDIPKEILLLAPIFAPIVAISMLHEQVSRARRWLILALSPMKILRPLITGSLFAVVWFLLEIQISGTLALAIIISGTLIVAITQTTLYQRKKNRLSIPVSSSSEPMATATEKLWPLALPLYLGRLAILTTKYSGIFLVGMIVGPVAAGAYFAAERLAILASIPLMIVNSVSSPGFATAHAENDHKKLQTTAAQSAHGSFWPTLIIALTLFIFGDWLLSLFGASYVAVAPILAVLVIGQIANCFTGSVGLLLDMCGEHKVVMRVHIITAIIHILILSLLLPQYGLMGAAVTSMLTTILQNFWLLFQVKKRLNIQPTVLGKLVTPPH